MDDGDITKGVDLNCKIVYFTYMFALFERFPVYNVNNNTV